MSRLMRPRMSLGLRLRFGHLDPAAQDKIRGVGMGILGAVHTAMKDVLTFPDPAVQKHHIGALTFGLQLANSGTSFPDLKKLNIAFHKFLKTSVDAIASHGVATNAGDSAEAIVAKDGNRALVTPLCRAVRRLAADYEAYKALCPDAEEAAVQSTATSLAVGLTQEHSKQLRAATAVSLSKLETCANGGGEQPWDTAFDDNTDWGMYSATAKDTLLTLDGDDFDQHISAVHQAAYEDTVVTALNPQKAVGVKETWEEATKLLNRARVSRSVMRLIKVYLDPGKGVGDRRKATRLEIQGHTRDSIKAEDFPKVIQDTMKKAMQGVELDD